MATSLGNVVVSEKRLGEIYSVAKRWCLCNGLGLRTPSHPGTIHVVAAPFALFPSAVPRHMLDVAKWTMPHFNTLMHRAALDHEFLEEAFKNVIEVDGFMRGLWTIYCKVREQGIRQPILLGLHRNDFMIDCPVHEENGHNSNNNNSSSNNNSVFALDGPRLHMGTANLRLKQIEFNTIASGMPGLGQKTTKLHRLTLSTAGREFTSNEVPDNTPAVHFAGGFVRAWELYGNPNAVIIFIVSEMEKNFLDQGALEFEIYSINPAIRVLRKTFLDIHKMGSLDNDGTLFLDGDEVALLYLRDGYTEANYPSQKEWDARLMMEISRAIKCPSIQYQLVGAKKIQQELARPGVLERYVKDPQVVNALKSTFADQYSLDLGPEGDEAMRLAISSPERFVLKPQREGGGNNLYDQDIVDFLNKNSASTERNAYVLMERIFPLQQQNFLCKGDDPPKLSSVASELGIFGLYIGTTEMVELENKECGFLMRTKMAGMAEGGIYSGSAVLDSLFIV